MRNEAEIEKLVIGVAQSDDRVRAVLLNGSRANPKVKSDSYQDFDIVYIVNQLQSFTTDHNWVDVFGKRIIMQLPDEMSFGEHNSEGFAYLMLFEDGNRIDLTLFPVEKVKKDFWPDSLTICLLDKDNLFQNLPEPTDRDYLIKKPTEKEFQDVCNEFWWVSTYVAKGLLRKEITYSSEMMETVVRPMFMKMIEWYIGVSTNFSVSFGKAGKYMKDYLPEKKYEEILKSYPGSQIENNWKALFVMIEIFSEFAAAVAEKLGFKYNLRDAKNVRGYLHKCFLQ